MKTKNILFITHTYTTFQKSQIESIANYFDNVFVLVRYKPIAEISRVLPIRYLRSHSKNQCIDLKNKPANIHIYTIPIFYFPWDKSYLNLGNRLYKKIKRFIRKNGIKFDLIHAHYLWTSGYVAIKLKKYYSKPVVITNHSTLQVSEFLSRSLTWKQKISQTITNADHIFVVNNFMKEKVREIDNKINVDIIPVGFNQEIFFPIEQDKARKSLSLPIGDTIILNISRLDDNKNLELFIKGSSKLLKKYPNLQSLIIGDGTNYNKLDKLINDLGVERNIKLLGMIPHQKINQWINACDFVALTSFSEGSPTVMYEALACGKPFLGSTVGGIPEIIIHEDYGCLFDPLDINDMVNKMEHMIGKKWDRERILAYGSLFSQKKISRDITNVYRKLIMGGKYQA
ncbi:MAG: glycosyltransferase [Chloroflexota bacterium]|nr:glycosyltransferase [Chloroflexota bacterium]